MFFVQKCGFCVLFGTGVLGSFRQGVFFDAARFNDVAGPAGRMVPSLGNEKRVPVTVRIWISKSH